MGVSEGTWMLIDSMLHNAKAMHFDGCHKIYLSMDNKQVRLMNGYGYDIVKPDPALIREWYEESCELRFIDAVFTNKKPNAGFVTLIPQGGE